MKQNKNEVNPGVRRYKPCRLVQSNFNSTLPHLRLINVPKLIEGAFESEESLINKTLHWLRGKYKCNSIIRDDIISAHRSSLRSEDALEIMVSCKRILDGLMSIEARDIRTTSLGIQISFSNCGYPWG